MFIRKIMMLELLFSLRETRNTKVYHVNIGKELSYDFLTHNPTMCHLILEVEPLQFMFCNGGDC